MKFIPCSIPCQKEMKNMVQVAAVILKNSAGEILICQRGAGGSCAYLWEFPGGKQEPQETMEQCAIRECREELGIEIAIDELYGKSQFCYPDTEIAFTFYLGHIVRGTPALYVHTGLCWVKPEQLHTFSFCPADQEILQRLQINA